MARSTDTASGEPEKKRRLGRRKKQRDPNNPGRIEQFRQVFRMTRKADPSAVWWMALAFLAVVIVALLVGIWLNQVVYLLVLGIPLGLLAAMAVLARKAEAAAFSQIEGQPGAVGAVLGSLRRGWYYDQEPVAAEAGGKVRGMRDLHNAAMVFRAVGRPGVVLITEGPKGPAQRLAQSERRKVARVAGEEIPVHLLRIGQGEGELRLRQLTRTMRKLPRKITKQEAIVVHQRLKSLGATKPPIPPGIDPRRVRMDRRALRGR
jgi:hypothetical protein